MRFIINSFYIIYGALFIHALFSPRETQPRWMMLLTSVLLSIAVSLGSEFSFDKLLEESIMNFLIFYIGYAFSMAAFDTGREELEKKNTAPERIKK